MQIDDIIRLIDAVANRGIAEFSIEREGVAIKFEPHPQGYVIRASVTQTVAAPEPMTFWINLPSRQARVRLSALANGSAPPAVMPVDPWRVAVAWRPAAVGESAWLLQFEEPQTQTQAQPQTQSQPQPQPQTQSQTQTQPQTQPQMEGLILKGTPQITPNFLR